MAADDVSLTELEVIAQFSLAVRSATAPRDKVVAALEADLRALTGGRSARVGESPAPAPVRTPGRGPAVSPAKVAAAAAPDEGAPTRPAAKAPGKAPAKTAKAPAKTSPRRTAP